MSLTSWLRILRSFSASAGAKRQRRSRPLGLRQVGRFRPQLEGLEDRQTPSTLSVTTALDVFDGGTTANPAGPDGYLSLREAISAANSGDQITFDQSLSGSTINLDPAKGELLIDKNLDIVGLGANGLTVSGQHQSRVFEIVDGATDSISGLTIENGNATFGGGIYNRGTLTVSGSTLSGNTGYYGGGIFNGYGGSTTLIGSTLSGNYATSSGGGISNERFGTVTVNGSNLSGNHAHSGGGIASGGTLTVNDSNLSGNTCSQLGGAILNGGGATATVNGSNLSSNSAVGNGNYYSDSGFQDNGAGGAIWSGGTLTVSGSTLSDNSARDGGGGIYNFAGQLTVSGSRLLRNTAGTAGGGAIWTSDYVGTGYAYYATVTISDSTLSDNSSSFRGGGIYNDGTLSVSGSTLSGNSAQYGGGLYNRSGNVTVSGSMLSANSAVVNGNGGGIYNESYGTVTVSNSSNIFGNSAYYGGGIYNRGHLNVTDSILCGNFATSGADLSNYGTAILTNSDVCVINQTITTTTVTSSNSPSVFGQVVTFKATVAAVIPGAGMPTGAVTFLLDGSTPLGVCTLDSSGQATLMTAGLSVGTHTITARYDGDANLVASTSPMFTQTVLSAQQELGLIVDQVNALVTSGILSSGNGNALIVKLNAAIASLNNGNIKAGDNQMGAFIDQVNAFVKSGKLDSADAQTLITDIDEAIAAALATLI